MSEYFPQLSFRTCSTQQEVICFGHILTTGNVRLSLGVELAESRTLDTHSLDTNGQNIGKLAGSVHLNSALTAVGILVVIHEVICKSAHGCSACVKKVMAAVQGDVLLLGGGKKCPTFLFLFLRLTYPKPAPYPFCYTVGFSSNLNCNFLLKKRTFNDFASQRKTYHKP